MITLFTHTKAPNGWKVACVMEILGLKYESRYLEPGSEEPGIKGPEHLKYNPNGRIPTIIDHDNDDFTLWESTTIIRYIVDRYDTEHKISFPRGSKQAFLVDQWMTFQASGQGPYFGQLVWFNTFHPEKLPSVIERYQKEVIRVVSVLDGVLAKQRFLVGDKLTVADIVFYTWDYIIFNPPEMLKGSPYREEINQFVNFLRWNDEVGMLPGVQKARAVRDSFPVVLPREYLSKGSK